MLLELQRLRQAAEKPIDGWGISNTTANSQRVKFVYSPTGAERVNIKYGRMGVAAIVPKWLQYLSRQQGSSLAIDNRR